MTYIPGGGGAVTEDKVQFIDEFNDASRHWAWWDWNTDAARRITEANGLLTMDSNNGTNMDWWSNGTNNALRAIIGVPGFPCEIITKIATFANADPSFGGLFIGRYITNAQSDSAIRFGHQYSGAAHSLYWQNLGGSINGSVAVATLPIWLKISLGWDSSNTIKAVFSYSTNGTTWTVAATLTNSGLSGGSPYNMITGLYLQTYAACPACNVAYEFFKIIRSFGPG